MDLATTATSKSSQAGMSLLSLTFGIGIGMLVVGVAVGLSIYMGYSFAFLANYVHMNNSSQNALSRISKEVRQTLLISSFSSNSVTFKDYDGQTLQYVYDSSARKLNRIKGGATEVLLSSVSLCQFSVFQRNVTDGTFDRVVSTNVATAKAVRINLTCSRSAGGARANTEEVQSADIVIRNGL